MWHPRHCLTFLLVKYPIGIGLTGWAYHHTTPNL